MFFIIIIVIVIVIINFLHFNFDNYFRKKFELLISLKKVHKKYLNFH